MKIFRFLTIAAVAVFLVVACAAEPAEPAASDEAASIANEYLSTEYANAANLRSQLAYGIMKLDGTSEAVTAEQAKALIPLWQGIIALSGDTTTADEELTAVQDQIIGTLTPEQLQAIAAMKLTNADLDAFYAEYGITLPTPVPGVTKVPGSGKTDAEKAAMQATAAASGEVPGSGAGKTAKTLLFEKTVEYLQGLSE